MSVLCSCESTAVVGVKYRSSLAEVGAEKKSVQQLADILQDLHASRSQKDCGQCHVSGMTV